MSYIEYFERKQEAKKTLRLSRLDLSPPALNIENDVYSINQKIAAHCVNMADEAIVRAVVAEAKAAGISQLFLLDKEFVINALKKAIAEEERGKE